MRYNNTGKTFISFSSINVNRSLFEIIFEPIVIVEADCKNSFLNTSLFWKSRSETNREVAQNFNCMQQIPSKKNCNRWWNVSFLFEIFCQTWFSCREMSIYILSKAVLIKTKLRKMSAAIWAVEMKKIPSCKSGPI